MVYTKKIEGVIPPIVTVLDDKGNFDKDGMARVIDFLIEEGVNGLFLLGSGGEFSQMSFNMRKEVAEFSISYINQRVPVLVGTGSNSTDESILLSKHAQNHGADGVVIINPYYWSLSEENILKHYKSICNSIDIPVILYNFPNLTGQDLSPDLVLKLVNENKNIIGIKETIDSISHVKEMILKVKGEHSNFKVFAGFDDHLLNTLQMGGDGAIPGTSNFAPELTVGIYKSYQKKDYQEAINLQKRLIKLTEIYKFDSLLLSTIKEALTIRGLNISPQVLSPAQTLSKQEKDYLEKVLKSIDLI